MRAVASPSTIMELRGIVPDIRVFKAFLDIIYVKAWLWLEANVAECWILINAVFLGFLLLLASSIFLTALVPEYAVDMDFLGNSKLLPLIPVTNGILNFITTVILFRRIFYVQPTFMFTWVMYYALQAVFILIIGFGMFLCIVIYLPQHTDKLRGAISMSMLSYYGIVKTCLGILCYLYQRWNKEYLLSLENNPSMKATNIQSQHYI